MGFSESWLVGGRFVSLYEGPAVNLYAGVVSMLRKQAKVLKSPPEHGILELSDRDRKAFFKALVNSPRPNARLMRGLANHRRRVASDAGK